MKILHISPAYFPAHKYGGPILSVHLLNKELVKIGVDVEVFTTNAGLENSNEIKLNRWNKFDDVKVKYFKYYGYEHYTFSPRLFIETLRKIRLYDLIHITAVWNFPTFAASLASTMNKIPFVISPRGTIYKETFEIKSTQKKIFIFSISC